MGADRLARNPVVYNHAVGVPLKLVVVSQGEVVSRLGRMILRSSRFQCLGRCWRERSPSGSSRRSTPRLAVRLTRDLAKELPLPSRGLPFVLLWTHIITHFTVLSRYRHKTLS